MKCIHPFLKKNKLNEIKPVPCGQCIPCLVNRKTFWNNRIAYDVMAQNRKGFGSSFLTLTLDEDHIKDGLVHKDDVQRFFKRLRKDFGIPFKHYTVSEYGSKGKRPHYHSILIGLPSEIASAESRRAWKYGLTDAQPVTSGRIHYVVDYLDTTTAYGKKVFTDLGLAPPFGLHSAGIGSALFDAQLDVIRDTGHYISRGRYYPVSDYWLTKLGVPISARTNFNYQSIAQAYADYKKHGTGFSSFQAYSIDNAHNKALVMYNAQINRLAPHYGIPLDDSHRFMPFRPGKDTKLISQEVLS